jgi:hypothetical protein
MKKTSHPNIEKKLKNDPEALAIWRGLSPEGRIAMLKLTDLSETMDEAEFELLFAEVGREIRFIRTGKAHDDA